MRRCSPRRCARRRRSQQTAITALQYGDPAGEPRLREALATKLAAHGVRASAAQIVTTIGATHALDIVTRTLLRAGDSVLVDEPGWSVEYARLAALGMRVLPVPRGADGPDIAAMRRLIEAQPADERPRLYVTVSVLHNPTGASLGLSAAHQVLRPGAAVRLSHRRGRHLRPPRAGARAAPGRARRARAHDLRLGLLEDPGAELARRLPRGAERARRSLRRHQAAVDADDAGRRRAGAGPLPRAGVAAPPCRAHRAAPRRGARPHRAPGRSARLPLRGRAARPVRLGRYRRRHRAARAAPCSTTGCSRRAPSSTPRIARRR